MITVKIKTTKGRRRYEAALKERVQINKNQDIEAQVLLYVMKKIGVHTAATRKCVTSKGKDAPRIPRGIWVLIIITEASIDTSRKRGVL